jgi:UV DNA damage endonuclease
MTKVWDYVSDLGEALKRLGTYIKDDDFRVSAHPDHFTFLNSNSQDVIEASIRDLDYHVKVFDAMGLSDYRYKLVLHVGGLYGNKPGSIDRFIGSFLELPDRIRKRIILENDDKSYTAVDVLGICNKLHIPMVLDVHHHNCINSGEQLGNILPEIFATWEGEPDPPKVHFSSPKSRKDFRSHADDINPDDFTDFVRIAEHVGKNIDIMLEAKNKDTALLNLSEALNGIEWLEPSSRSDFSVLSGRKAGDIIQ